MDHSRIISAQERIYSTRFREYGDTPQGVFWNNTETQYLRFERLLRHTLGNAPTAPALHEIGCGTAALFEYLKARSIACDYSGTDIVPDMLEIAQKRHPEGKFYQRDVLTTDISEAYDFVVASGVFNYRDRVKPETWNKYVEDMLSKMFSMARCGIAFNFLTSNITIAPDPTLHYADPAVMLRFCQNRLSRFHVLDQSYPLYEVTLTVFKEAHIKGSFSSEAYGKYFA